MIALVGTFVLSLSLADLAATKFIVVGSTVAPGGIFLFAVIFVVRDMLHKLMGADFVKKTILVAAVLNVGMGLYFYWITRFPSPAFRPAGEWDTIFALAPAIVIGSIIAAVASQWVNTVIYDRLWARGLPQWGRVVGSNSVSLPIDSILFTGFAFMILPPLFGAEGIDLASAATRVASGQTVWKAVIMLAMTPLIYLIPANREVAPAGAR